MVHYTADCTLELANKLAEENKECMPIPQKRAPMGAAAMPIIVHMNQNEKKCCCQNKEANNEEDQMMSQIKSQINNWQQMNCCGNGGNNSEVICMCDQGKEESAKVPEDDNICGCSYEILHLEMKEPNQERNYWTAVVHNLPDKRKKEGEGDEVQPCKRPNCIHVQPKSVCLYDEPCKASCFEHPPGMKPHKYPFGYPNKDEVIPPHPKCID